MKRKAMDLLLEWKKDGMRQPVVLSGTRQTGKTWLAKELGKRCFAHQAYFHLETDGALRAYFSQETDPGRLLEYLEIRAQVPIRAGTTLVILDEIQACPKAREALGAFAAEFPGYAILAVERATDPSLSALPLADARTVPVGVLDFEEFLWACREVSLAREIREHFLSRKPLSKEAHHNALHYFRLYLAVGGFPAAVECYRTEHSLLGIPDIHSKIRQLDLSDLHAAFPPGARCGVRSCYLSLPRQLLKENPYFQYRMAQKGSTRQLMEEKIRFLSDTGMAVQVTEKSSLQAGVPHFKLYPRDPGLCAAGMDLPAAYLLQGKGDLALRRLVENALAVIFASNGYQLSCWSSGNRAQVPFLLWKDGRQLAVDLHLEPDKKSRSLFEYRRYEPDIPFFQLTWENFREKGPKNRIPCYGAFCI